MDTPQSRDRARSHRAERYRMVELSLLSSRRYDDPFGAVQLDAVVTEPDGNELRVPAFWAGGDEWRVRYASGKVGRHTYRTECSDAANDGLHDHTGQIEVTPYTGDNPLYRHGPLRVARDRRHFAHADGTPFFWLGDTWWMGLCRLGLGRLSARGATEDSSLLDFDMLQTGHGLREVLAPTVETL